MNKKGKLPIKPNQNSFLCDTLSGRDPQVGKHRFKSSAADSKTARLLSSCPLPPHYKVTFVSQALKSVVLYVILSPYDNEQSDLVHRISADKKLEEIPKYK